MTLSQLGTLGIKNLKDVIIANLELPETLFMWYFAHSGTLVCVSLQTHLILIQVAVNTAFNYVKQAKGGEKSAYFIP